MRAGERARDADSVDRVMNQVLAAEREARGAIERCRAEAMEILAAAEEGARLIAHRAERRIKLAQNIADQAVERVLRELRVSESGSGLAMPEADVRELLDRAVEDLVYEILSPQP